MHKMDQLEFVQNIDNYPTNSDSFTITIHAGFSNKTALLDELSTQCSFPAYFGHNWDALSDCLRDFSWIAEEKIVLVHDISGIQDIALFKTYLEVLLHAIRNWQPGEAHTLHAVFPVQYKETVLEAMQ